MLIISPIAHITHEADQSHGQEQPCSIILNVPLCNHETLNSFGVLYTAPHTFRYQNGSSTIPDYEDQKNVHLISRNIQKEPRFWNPAKRRP